MRNNQSQNLYYYTNQLPLDTIYFDVETEDPGHSPEEFQQHTHQFYEILFIRKGNPQYRIGNERFRLEPGDLIFIPPGVNHLPLFSRNDAKTYHRCLLWLSEPFVESIKPLFPEGGFQHFGLLRTKDTCWHFVENCFLKGLQEIHQKKPGYTAILYAHTLELMTHLYRAFLDTQSVHPPSESPQFLDQILDYVEQNLSRKITLADTARHFYVSESTVSTLFRKSMGISFYRCVTVHRLIAAKKMILDGMPLEEVSREVGFGDYSSFYRAFKGEYGISPKELRSKNK